MTSDPWAAWNRMWNAGMMMNEMLTASGRVIDRRSQVIGRAFDRPQEGDAVELGRMVSEKAEAFSLAGASLARDWWSLQGELVAQSFALGNAMMSGRVPTVRASRAIAARQQRLTDHALASSVRAMRPIHGAATANDRRLRKSR